MSIRETRPSTRVLVMVAAGTLGVAGAVTAAIPAQGAGTADSAGVGAAVQVAPAAPTASTLRAKAKLPVGITVKVVGLPGGVAGNVVVTGPKLSKKKSYRAVVTKTTVLKRLKAGSYTVTANPVTVPGGTATPSPTVRKLKVKATSRLSAIVSYLVALTPTPTPTPTPVDVKWKQISTSTFGTCAVTTTGAAYCWGRNDNGQLGNGSFKESLVPTPVSGLSSGVASISRGDYGACVVTTGGAVWCWGLNTFGRLGNGTTARSLVPVPVTGMGSGVASISASINATCAVTTGGAAYCWGQNQYGQLGNGITTNGSTTTPAPVAGMSTGVTSISIGWDEACAVKAGAAYCWGKNTGGALGDGTNTSSNVPVGVSGLASGVASISTSNNAELTGQVNKSCAVTTGGAAYCWGGNDFGGLGDNTTSNSSTPVPVFGMGSGVASISSGTYVTCAVTTVGAASCWGYNGNGQVGAGMPIATDSAVPAGVSGLASGVASISNGDNVSCAVTTAGAAYCWGYNGEGAFGNGARGPLAHSNVPVAVHNPA
ncbi:MAG: biotin transporter BioY [Actinomycetes bacterium]